MAVEQPVERKNDRHRAGFARRVNLSTPQNEKGVGAIFEAKFFEANKRDFFLHPSPPIAKLGEKDGKRRSSD